MIWALAKLQWDASLDIDALLREFYDKMFGRAAGTMGRYYDLLERSYNAPRPGHDGWEHRNIVQQALAMSPEDVDAGMALLAQAAKEAESDAVRRRIETVRAALQYAGYAIKSYALSQRALAAPVTEARQADTVLRDVEEVARLSAERETFWPAAMQRADLLGENLRGLAGHGYLIRQTAPLESGAVTGGLKALAWYGENAPERLPEIRARLAQAALRGDVAGAVRAYLWVQEHRPPTLVANGGFEERGSSASGP